MSTFITFTLAVLIIGYALFTLKKELKAIKKGKCSGCSSCPMSEKCADKQ